MAKDEGRNKNKTRMESTCRTDRIRLEASRHRWPAGKNKMKMADLPGLFRETAEFLREKASAEQAACAWEKAAIEVEESLRESLLEPLPLDMAELESGYSRSHLRRLLREGIVPNSGTEEDPRILRTHLPIKPGHGVSWARTKSLSSRTQVAARVVQGGSDDTPQT